jgi:hypothetical protein
MIPGEEVRRRLATPLLNTGQHGGK